MKKIKIYFTLITLFVLFLVPELHSQWLPQTSGTPQLLYSSQMLNANTGWVAGNSGTIRFTSNGGTNWAASTSGTTQTFYCMYFVNTSTGWVGREDGTILKTTNAGANWVPQVSGTTQGLLSIYF